MDKKAMLTENQRRVDRYIRKSRGYWNQKSMVIQLGSEVGEFDREVLKSLGTRLRKGGTPKP